MAGDSSSRDRVPVTSVVGDSGPARSGSPGPSSSNPACLLVEGTDRSGEVPAEVPAEVPGDVPGDEVGPAAFDTGAFSGMGGANEVKGAGGAGSLALPFGWAASLTRGGARATVPDGVLGFCWLDGGAAFPGFAGGAFSAVLAGISTRPGRFFSSIWSASGVAAIGPTLS